jgi:hypothetical protein
LHHKKTFQAGIEKEFKSKQQQEAYVTKAREKYEADCVRINSYTAQSSLVQGKDLEKINLKLERAQQTVQSNERDFANFAKAVQDTTQKWEQDWKAFCDSCQDLEESRLEFMKDNMWSYANAVSTVCVSDDEVRTPCFYVLNAKAKSLFSHVRRCAWHLSRWNQNETWRTSFVTMEPGTRSPILPPLSIIIPLMPFHHHRQDLRVDLPNSPVLHREKSQYDNIRCLQRNPRSTQPELEQVVGLCGIHNLGQHSPGSRRKAARVGEEVKSLLLNSLLRSMVPLHLLPHPLDQA